MTPLPGRTNLLARKLRRPGDHTEVAG